MKKLFMVIPLLSTLLYSSISSSDIKNMISKIKEERIGIGLHKLDATSNPFIMNKKKEAKVEKKQTTSVVAKRVIAEPVYKLDVILNHAAFINKKWYKKGDKLGMYTIDSIIGTSSIILKSKSGFKTLSIEKKKKNFIQLNQGNK